MHSDRSRTSDCSARLRAISMLIFGLSVAAFMCVPTTAFAQSSFSTVPSSFPIQGYLTDSNGPVDGTRNIKLELFTKPAGTDGGGELLYRESWSSAQVDDGVFTLELGAGTSSDDGQYNSLSPNLFKENPQIFLQISVNGQPLTPRRRIESAPYAAVAERAVTASSADKVGSVPAEQVYTQDNKPSLQDLGYSGGDGIDIDQTTSSIKLASCSAGEVYRYTSSGWSCAPPVSSGSVDKNAIGTDAVGQDEIVSSEVQERISGECGNGKYMVGANMDGSPICDDFSSQQFDENSGTLSIATDAVTSTEITSGAVGSSELSNGAVGSSQIDSSQVQERIGSDCGSGKYAVGVQMDGTLNCNNYDSQYFSETSGSLSLASGAVGATEVDDSQIQERISSSCGAGKFMVGAKDDGTPICDEYDSQQFNESSGVLSIASDGVNSNELAPSAVGSSEINSSQVQERLGSCGSNAYMVGANMNGSPICTGYDTNQFSDSSGTLSLVGGAVGSDEIDSNQVQERIDTSCGAREYVVGVNTDGTPVCDTLASTQFEEVSGGVVRLKSGAVDTNELAGSAVTTNELASTSVSTGKIQDSAVTDNKRKYDCGSTYIALDRCAGYEWSTINNTSNTFPKCNEVPVGTVCIDGGSGCPDTSNQTIENSSNVSPCSSGTPTNPDYQLYLKAE